MATFEDLEKFLQELPDKVMDDTAEIVSETAVEYFKNSFTKKAFDGNPWKEGNPKPTGSLLVESANLLNSIQPVEVSRERVVVSAGNDKVDYAKVHNEGYQGEVVINPFVRKNGQEVKQHTRKMNIPKRQFMGKADELAELIKDRLNGFLKVLK